MRGHAKRIFEVGLRAHDAVGTQFLREEGDQRLARRRRWWYAEQPPGQVVDRFARRRRTAVDHQARQFEWGSPARRRNELACGLLPADVAGNPRVELLVALQ